MAMPQPAKMQKSHSPAGPRHNDVPRARIKTSKYVNDGEGGYTLAHDENGDVIRSIVVHQEKQPKTRHVPRKPIVKLIYCRQFTDNYPAPFSVTVSFTALLQMDLHAHSSLSEVMGLVGGSWDSRLGRLTITRYEPCTNSAGSATHCDMCPVSQARATDALLDDGVQVLGWFHSHPTFAPEPSRQDLETQLSLQEWIGNAAKWQPFVGIILSPYSLHGALIASPYRCLVVNRTKGDGDDDDDDDAVSVPYKFNVVVDTRGFNVKELMGRARRIWHFAQRLSHESRVDFTRPYFLDKSFSFVDKFISSIKMHLAKCSDINKMTCDAIVEGFTEICCRKYNPSSTSSS